MEIYRKKGANVIEIIIITAIIGLLVAIVLPQFSRIRESSVLQGAVNDILSSLDKARSETLASINSSTYGVRLESSSVIIFKGSAYSSGNSNNETISLTYPASITNVTLGGVSASTGELYFNRLTGAPSKVGIITVATTTLSKTITVSATGEGSVN